MYIGHTYYINVNDHSHLNDDNENLYLGFTSDIDNFSSEYSFENTS